MRMRIAVVVAIVGLFAAALPVPAGAEQPTLPPPCGKTRWILVNVLEVYAGGNDGYVPFPEDSMMRGRRLLDTCEITAVQAAEHRGIQATWISLRLRDVQSFGFTIHVVSERIEAVCAMLDCAQAPTTVDGRR